MLSKKKVRYILLLVVVGLGIVGMYFPTFQKENCMIDFLKVYYSMSVDRANQVLDYVNHLESDETPFYVSEIKSLVTEKAKRRYLTSGVANRMIDYKKWGISDISLLSIDFEYKEDKYYFNGEVEVIHSQDGKLTYDISGFVEMKKDGFTWKVNDFEETDYLYNQLLRKYEN